MTGSVSVPVKGSTLMVSVSTDGLQVAMADAQHNSVSIEFDKAGDTNTINDVTVRLVAISGNAAVLDISA